ncbi:hypothetical protein FO440_23485 [Mucilaginibacter corticis]|uniref:Uncharacterized protein n=1 Tax=Mucilaginibacter corticis TaxID=2597670 RepID=A0A556M7M4_9SPHI|nr:hypothetical protein [Mucilaginibacter corticis]TSJ35887.1 hypothetical protein FO440_23485 [Mucilaginibacter corticis]
MKTLLLLFLLFSDCKHPVLPTDSTYVYICDSPGGKKYHLSQNCKGLHNCSHKIVKLTLEQAKKRGKTLCRYEK